MYVYINLYSSVPCPYLLTYVLSSDDLCASPCKALTNAESVSPSLLVVNKHMVNEWIYTQKCLSIDSRLAGAGSVTEELLERPGSKSRLALLHFCCCLGLWLNRPIVCERLNSHFGLAPCAVVMVMLLLLLRDIVQLLHRLRAARGEGLSLGGCLVHGRSVLRGGVVRGTGMGVHFCHLIAVQEGRGGHEHVRVGYGSGHGLVAVEPGALDGHHLVGRDQWILRVKAVL